MERKYSWWRILCVGSHAMIHLVHWLLILVCDVRELYKRWIARITPVAAYSTGALYFL